MATLARADLAAVMNLIFQDPMILQFRRDIVLASLLPVVDGRNENCTWPVKSDGRTAGGAYAEGADMADGDYDSHDRLRASLNWAEYRAGAKVSGLAQAVASASGLGDQFREEIGDATDQVAVLVGADMYAGDPGASPVELGGCALAIDGSGDAFAGLDPDTYPNWASNEDTIEGDDLSVKNIREKLLRPIKDDTGRDPDFMVTTGAVFDQVKDILGDKAQTTTMISTARGTVDITAVAGARAVVIDGVPLIEDRHCTASTIYGISSRFVEIRQVPAARGSLNIGQIVAAIKALTGIEVSDDDVKARLAARSGVMMPAIDILAPTGDAMKAMVKWYGQLAWKRRNAHGKLVLT